MTPFPPHSDGRRPDDAAWRRVSGALHIPAPYDSPRQRQHAGLRRWNRLESVHDRRSSSVAPTRSRSAGLFLRLAEAFGAWLAGWRAPAPARAFSLIEIMVVVGLLSVIILGLLLMFNQTQRAFRTGMTQVDVLEGGRAATAMLARELSQITPSYRTNPANFYAAFPPVTPLYQNLPGSTGVRRTNVLSELYFLTRENLTWRGIGYRVSDVDSGVGSLYRFQATNHVVFDDPTFLFARYNNTPLTNMSRVVDGVVHFKIRAFDTNGVWIVDDLQPDNANTDIRWSTTVAPSEIGLYNFFSNAVPAFVEFELGILEERTLARARALPVGTVRRNFLAEQAGKVHVFRLRVPVRNVDVTAYQ